jgi:hypothetical protein
MGKSNGLAGPNTSKSARNPQRMSCSPVAKLLFGAKLALPRRSLPPGTDYRHPVSREEGTGIALSDGQGWEAKRGRHCLPGREEEEEGPASACLPPLAAPLGRIAREMKSMAAGRRAARPQVAASIPAKMT